MMRSIAGGLPGGGQCWIAGNILVRLAAAETRLMRARPALVLMAWAAAATPRCRASEAAQAFAERIHWDYAGRTTQLQEFGKMGTDGVIVLQEWWGVTSQVQKQAQRIASQGYRCLVPDLYNWSQNQLTKI